MTEEELKKRMELFRNMFPNAQINQVNMGDGYQQVNIYGNNCNEETSEVPEEPSVVPEGTEVANETVDAENQTDTQEDNPITDALVKSSGIKGNYARDVLELMYGMREQMENATYWAAVYCVVHQRGWIDDNVTKWCEIVNAVTGSACDHSNMSKVLRELGNNLDDWDEHDLRRRKARRAGLDFREALEDIIKQRKKQARQI